jgi:hypothetical protein
VAAALLITTGCDSSKPTDTTALIKGYKLIDSNRSDEAIISLETAVQSDPQNPDKLIALSSAYAAYAGVSIPTLFPVIDKMLIKKDLVAILKDMKKNRLDFDRDSAAKKSYERLKDLASAWMDLMTFISMSFDSFNLLPELTSEKTQYLRQAISIAESIRPQKKGYALYSAVLRLVLLKNDLIHDSLPSVMHGDDKGICRLYLNTVPDFAHNLQDSVDRIFNDLKIAFPKQKNSYQKMMTSFQDTVREISASATGLDTLTDLGSTLSFKLGVEQALGRAFECGSQANP